MTLGGTSDNESLKGAFSLGVIVVPIWGAVADMIWE